MPPGSTPSVRPPSTSAPALDPAEKTRQETLLNDAQKAAQGLEEAWTPLWTAAMNFLRGQERDGEPVTAAVRLWAAAKLELCNRICDSITVLGDVEAGKAPEPISGIRGTFGRVFGTVATQAGALRVLIKGLDTVRLSPAQPEKDRTEANRALDLISETEREFVRRIRAVDTLGFTKDI